MKDNNKEFQRKNTEIKQIFCGHAVIFQISYIKSVVYSDTDENLVISCEYLLFVILFCTISQVQIIYNI